MSTAVAVKSFPLGLPVMPLMLTGNKLLLWFWVLEAKEFICKLQSVNLQANFLSGGGFHMQEKAAKWKNPDGHMDGLTTNGVLVMHPKGGFTEESKPGVWREISVCGDVYTLRETRSAQQRGKLVSGKQLVIKPEQG